MHRSRIKESQSFLMLSLLIFLFLIFLTMLFPYTGDDWAWGSSIGIERLMSFFKNYNGRYFGNLLVMVLTRNSWIKVIVMASSYYLSCWLCCRYTSSRKSILLLFAFTLFLLMPKGIFVQAIVWTAGYANYVPPALICVGWILVVRDTTGIELPKYSKRLPIVSFLVGVIGALFIENITVFNICFGLVVIIYTRMKYKRYDLVHISFLLGALLGAGVMFSNGAYGAIAAGADGYRSTADSIQELIVIVASHAYDMLDTLIISNNAFCAITSILLLLMAWKYLRRSSCEAKINVVGIVLINVISFLLNLIVKIVCNFSRYVPSLNAPGFLLIGSQMTIAMVYVLSLVGTVLLCVEQKRKMQMMFPIVCIPAALIPLLVVNPIGPRCYFVAYLLMMVFLVDLLEWILCDAKIKAHNAMFSCLAFIAVVVAVFNVNIYYQIHEYDVKRAEFAKIQSDNGNKTVIICG